MASPRRRPNRPGSPRTAAGTVVGAWLGGEVGAALDRANRTYDAPWPLNAPPRRGKLDVRILIGKSMYLLKHFAPGDILFRQGDPSDHVVLVRSGRADVLREVGEDLILLGTANEGEFLGEMGVLDERPRSATVRAASALEVELISRQSFLERVSGDPQLAQKLLVRMSARLRDVEDMLANLHAASAEAKARGRAAAKATPALRLEATTYAAMLYIGSEPIRITGLPYVVGRAGEIGEPPMARRPDLEIPDPKPYRLSRQHFCIMSEDDTVQLRDLNSELGTIVNEVPLGHDFAQDRIALRRGENVVMAGGRGSPYAFTVTLSS